jgi:hypothetical protein
MSIAVRFSPVSLTAQTYDDTLGKIAAAGEWPPSGLEFHVCFGSGDNLRVAEVWSSPEQFAAFGERLMPILAAAGIELTGPPEISEVHNVIRP